MGIQFEIDHNLVRGLDYYSRTTFEILSSSLGAQDALCGGGRYDGLVEMIGGKSTPGIDLLLVLKEFCWLRRMNLMRKILRYILLVLERT